jgi:hypothetical protein
VSALMIAWTVEIICTPQWRCYFVACSERSSAGYYCSPGSVSHLFE